MERADSCTLIQVVQLKCKPRLNNEHLASSMICQQVLILGIDNRNRFIRQLSLCHWDWHWDW